MANHTKRTDEHRPGAIIPASYSPLLCYSLPASDGGWPIPAMGVDCTHEAASRDKHGVALTYREHSGDRCCVATIEAKATADGLATFGRAGRCGVCGAFYVYGELWKHEPTGALVHLGHDCSAKYELLMDRSAWELENGRVRAAEAKACSRAKNTEERTAFLAEHPGLEADLAVEHPIITDIAQRFVMWRSISPKQVALVQKLANEVRNPAPAKPEEQHVDAPTGKGIEFEGEIVSTKFVENDYGGTTKMLVKVATPAGTWLAWGTVPASLFAETTSFKGRLVAVRATLELPRAREVSSNEFDENYVSDAQRATMAKRAAEKHFVFMSRPTARFIEALGLPAPAKVKKPRAPKAVACRGCSREFGELRISGQMVLTCTRKQCSDFVRNTTAEEYKSGVLADEEKPAEAGSSIEAVAAV